RTRSTKVSTRYRSSPTVTPSHPCTVRSTAGLRRGADISRETCRRRPRATRVLTQREALAIPPLPRPGDKSHRNGRDRVGRHHGGPSAVVRSDADPHLPTGQGITPLIVYIVINSLVFDKFGLSQVTN